MWLSKLLNTVDYQKQGIWQKIKEMPEIFILCGDIRNLVELDRVLLANTKDFAVPMQVAGIMEVKKEITTWWTL